MTCNSCTSSVESVLRQLPGVLSADVSLVTGVAKVSYDGNRTGACVFMCVVFEGAVGGRD